MRDKLQPCWAGKTLSVRAELEADHSRLRVFFVIILRYSQLFGKPLGQSINYTAPHPSPNFPFIKHYSSRLIRFLTCRVSRSFFSSPAFGGGSSSKPGHAASADDVSAASSHHGASGGSVAASAAEHLLHKDIAAVAQGGWNVTKSLMNVKAEEDNVSIRARSANNHCNIQYIIIIRP